MWNSKYVWMLGLVWAATPLWSEGHHWGYSGAGAPEQWASMDPAFSACSAGKNQSPVDITSVTQTNLKPIAFAYGTGGNELINNGHTLQVNFPAGNTITVDGQTF